MPCGEKGASSMRNDNIKSIESGLCKGFSQPKYWIEWVVE